LKLCNKNNSNLQQLCLQEINIFLAQNLPNDHLRKCSKVISQFEHKFSLSKRDINSMDL